MNSALRGRLIYAFGVERARSAPGEAPCPGRVCSMSPDTVAVNPYRIYGAEAVGTAVLMLIGPGTAILAADAVGPVGVSLSFGFALLAMVYAIGNVSGSHINPAVT